MMIGGRRVRIFCRCDAWEWGVIFLSVLTLTRGLLYTLKPDGSASFVLDQLGPVFGFTFGILWLWAALWAIVSTWLHRRARRALLMQCGLFLFWGTFYVASVPIRSDNIYSGLLFLMLAGWAGVLPRLVAMPKLRRRGR
jgi:hypothetical protein